MLDALLTILQALVGWLLLLIWQMLLMVVDVLEKFFNAFAGVDPVYYKGEDVYLFSLFLSNKSITNLFWGMALIAIVLSFGFCIVAVARKVTDVSGTTKHTLGQIMSNFIRSLVVILLLNLCIVAAINVTSVIFDRINYSLKNADTLDRDKEKHYSDEEFATMVRILATMGNYAANPSAESRYNVNACFNAVRGEMLTLFEARCFDYDFPVVQTGKHTWQSALAQVAKSANLKEDLQLDTYYPSVQEAVLLCFKELKSNSNFKPQETAISSPNTSANLTTAKMIFLVSTMGAEENEQFKNGSFDDALRRSYINGEKNYLSYDDVDSDFAITRINYLIGLLVTAACVILLGKVILMFIVRMLNVMMLYIVSPLFASAMSLDEGSRFQNWVQSFVMQLLAAYASVVMMRLYLMMVPIVVNNELHFFSPSSFSNHLDIYGQLLFVLAGAWAVYQGGNLISGALVGNAASAFQSADSTMGGTVDSLIGVGRLGKMIDRHKRRKDSQRSHEKAHEKTQQKADQSHNESMKAMKDLQTAIEGRDSGRTNNVSDGRYNSAEKASLDKMRKEFGFSNEGDGGKGSSVDSTEHAIESSHLNKMRADMGLDNPDTPDNFNLDALPDLGRGKGKAGTKGNTGSTGNTGKTTATGKTETKGSTGKNQKTGSTEKKNTAHRDRLKARISRTTDDL